MESYQSERIINLKYLLVKLAKLWKWIAGAAAAGAIIVSLRHFLKLRSAYSVELKAFEEGVKDAVEPTPVSYPFSYIFIGFLFGLIIAVAVIFLKDFLSTKLKTAFELDRPKGTQLLAVFKKTQDTKAELYMKKLLCTQTTTSEEKEAKLLYSRLLTTCRNQEISHLVFAGDAAEEDPQLLLDVAERLQRYGIPTDCIGNILDDPEAILCLNAGDGIVLVAKVGQTTYKTLDEELAQCTRQKTNLVGFVAFE